MDHLNSASNHLFPTKASFLIFWLYISLFVSQGLLVKAVHQSKIYGFNPIVVVLLTELVKLLICISVYLIRSQGNISNLINDIHKNNKLLLLYLVPSFLYCLYNNLTFINLQLFDLTTYYCLMQFRIVLTAIIYQILFRRQLTLLQWISLGVLTAGCLIKEYGLLDDMEQKHKTNRTSTVNATAATSPLSKDGGLTILASESNQVNPLIKFFGLTLMILLQMFCSCFAGVYNEYLLKDSSTAVNADVILQNIFMYLDSIFCNLIVYKLAPASNGNKDVLMKTSDVISTGTVLYNLLTSPLVIILILNNAFSGLVASFFLKSLNSILKTFASALELFAIAFFAWILFDNQVDLHTIIALILVTLATFLYSKNPVSVAPPGRVADGKDGFVLLPQSED